MAKSPSFSMRLEPLDKGMLKELAQRLKRDQTETIRVLVREALAILKEQDAQNEQDQKTNKKPTAAKVVA